MSAAYNFKNGLPKKEQFVAELSKLGVFEEPAPDQRKDAFLLTDNDDYVWCYVKDDCVELVKVFGSNNPKKILSAISDVYNGDFVSEYE